MTFAGSLASNPERGEVAKRVRCESGGERGSERNAPLVVGSRTNGPRPGPHRHACGPQADDDDHPGAHAADAGEDRLPSGLPDAGDQQGHAQHGHHQTGRGNAGSGRGAGSGHREGFRIAGKTKGPRLTRALNVAEVVGATGFEPATSRSRTERSTKLSHAPMAKRQCSTRAQRRCRRIKPRRIVVDGGAHAGFSVSRLTERCVRSPETGTALDNSCHI